MKFLLALFIPFLVSFHPSPGIGTDNAGTLKKIFDTELSNGTCYENLRSLCNDVGGRLSGSPQAQKAVLWGQAVLKRMNADTVYLQECMVPHWVRGEKEKLTISTADGGDMKLNVCALGGSVGTPKVGVSGNVIEVHSIEELKALGEAKLKGKIVFYNRPMDATQLVTFDAYGKAVDQRANGASAAAPYGAVAVLVRSMNLRLDDFPHTGVQIYKDSVTKIPTAAISTNDAEKLSMILKGDPKLRATLTMSCQTLPDEKSYNVVAEIRGSEFPDQYITVGGHWDSWDMAQGAHDDGAGVAHSIEVISLYKKLGWKPKHTIRCVLFMNEENGGRGAKKYLELAKERHEKHLAAIESDRGGFAPRGFGVDGDSANMPSYMAKMKSWSELLKPYGICWFEAGESGADVGGLKSIGAVCYGFIPDSQRYFDYHHASTDTFDAINKRELEMGAASITALVYLIDNYGVTDDANTR